LQLNEKKRSTYTTQHAEFSVGISRNQRFYRAI